MKYYTLIILLALLLSNDGKDNEEKVLIDYLPLQKDPSFRTILTAGIGERHEADFIVTGTMLENRDVLCLNARLKGLRPSEGLHSVIQSRPGFERSPSTGENSFTRLSDNHYDSGASNGTDTSEISEPLSKHLSRVAIQFHFSPLDLHTGAWNQDKAGNSFSFTLLIPFSRRFEFGVSYSECTVDAYSSATTKYTCRSVTGQINALLSTGSFVPYAGVFAGHGTYDGDGDPGGMQAGAHFGVTKRFKSGFRIGTAVVYTKQSEKGWGGYMISVPLFLGFQFNP